MAEQEVEHAYAPFSSTADRSAGGATAAAFSTPGPGTYDVTGKRYWGGPRFNTASSDVGFLSKAARASAVETEALLKPGPGQYTLPSEFDVRRSMRGRSAPGGRGGSSSPQKNVLWFRAPTAPSIPKQDEAFGYEEGPNGQLVKQQAPFKRYAGVGADAIGPGNYDPSIKGVLPNPKGVPWGRSKTVRVSFGAPGPGGDSTPGPGTYDVASAVSAAAQAPSQRRTAPSAAFNSRVLRPHQHEVKEELAAPKLHPGPGAYNIPDSFSKARASVPEALQCFGSTSKRASFDARAANAPGPGSYDVGSFGEGSRGAAVRMQRRAAPFLSTGGRFDDVDRRRAELPGPGQYDQANRNTFVAELARKRFSRGGHFGSTVQRFSFKREEDKAPAPGPADYEPKAPKFVHGQVKKGPMSVFLSDSSRFKKAQALNREGPAPGQYYKSAEWGTGYKRPENAPGKRAFISTGQRFQDPAMKKDAPGPGQYSSDVGTVGGEVNKLLKRRMLSGDEAAPGIFGGAQRFANLGKSAGPGPGAYNAIDPYAQLIKRSFNITVEGSI